MLTTVLVLYFNPILSFQVHIGFSIIKHASLHSVQQFGNTQLDFQNHSIIVLWHGNSDIVWEDVEFTIRSITEQRGHLDWVM